MKEVHIVIPDLFLPQQLAAYACGDLRLPALEKLLARAQVLPLHTDTLEGWLCEQFGVEGLAIAPLTLQADGVQHEGAYWLRADPVGVQMRRDEMVLQADVTLTVEEAAQLCASLNAHFAEDGLHFVAPHPQRWYLRLESAPGLETYPLPQVVGADMHAHLPRGADALRWHSVLNEIQMLFYEHAVNLAREQRGELPVSGVWLWGGGKPATELLQPFAAVAGDSELAAAFARAAGVPILNGAEQVVAGGTQADNVLVVWEGLRHALQSADIGRWRNAVQHIERDFAVPLLAALEAGKVGRITLDILGEHSSRRFELTRSARWKIWRRRKPLLDYALTVQQG
jgi:hypothetical protein